MTSQPHRKDSHVRGSSSRATTLTKIVVLTSIVSRCHGFQNNLNTGLSIRLDPITGRIPIDPCYERRRKHCYATSLRSSALFPTGAPSPELDNDAHDPLQETFEANLSSNDDDNSSISLKDKIVLVSSSALGAASLFNLLSMASTGCWRYFLAGGVCAAVSHAIPTPIDVVKTRKQIDPELAELHMLKAARRLVKKEGMGVLWAGLGPTVFGYLIEGAVKFGVYEVLKPVIKTFLSNLAKTTSIGFFNSSLLAFMLSGVVSGFSASVMLCPMEALRIRMVADPDFAPNGFLQGGHQILRREGVAGLGKGLSPMVLKQVPYTVTKNVSFDIFTTALYAMMRAQSVAMTAGMKFAVPLVSAVVASILSCITSQPGDMVLSLINAQEGEERPASIFRRIFSDSGIGGFFVGFKTRMVHVGMVVTLQLLIYDYVKRMCGIAATGCV